MYPERSTDAASKRAPGRRWVAIGGVALAAIMAGGVFALVVSGRDDAPPLAADASPTPTAAVQRPSPTASPSDSPAPSATPAPTPEPTATAAPPSDGEAWIGPERIATRAYGELSLVVDDAGIAHAAAELDHAIYYLTNATGSWTREPLSMPPAGGHDGYPTIAMDRDGSLAVAFVRFQGWQCELSCYPVQPDGVYIATNISGAWREPSRVPIEYRADWPTGVSLALLDGAVHVAFAIAGEAESAIWYGTNTGGSWTTERVAAAGGGPELALAADGTARIAFTTRDGVRYATAASPRGSFSVDRLPDEFASQSVYLLTLEASGWLHLVFHDEQNGGLLHVRWDEGGWSSPEPAFPGTDGMPHPCEGWSSLEVGAKAMAVSDRGTVHLISRNDRVFAGLWYATSRSGRFEALHLSPPEAWDTDYCNAADFLAERPATIAVDSLGRPHILFMGGLDLQGGPRELWYAIGPGD